MDPILKDERFSWVLNDPRFKKMPGKKQKTKMDKRFQAMFKDENFKSKCRMDKYGRPVNSTTTKELRKFYEMSDSDAEETSDKNEEGKYSSENDRSSKDSKNKNADKISKMQIMKDKKSMLGVKKQMEKKVHSKVTSSRQAEALEKSDDDDSDMDEKLVTQKCENSELDDESDDANDEIVDKLAGRKSESSESEDESDDDDEIDDKLAVQESESSESDDESDDDEIDEAFDHKWQELDADAPPAKESTNRIAVCNMDWDRIRAQDIFAVFDSFKPLNSVILSVKVYPSEFGLKRMEDEKLHGPTELVEETVKSDEEKEEERETEKEGSRYHREKLRQYQINRLKYYYAVVECDSVETANSLYEQLNGMEYESSAVCMDLRFVPDDVIFDQEPTSVATSLPNTEEYKPRLFITSALQQVNVNLTWDETDPERREVIKKAFTETESIEKDIQTYLAPPSSEESEEENDMNDGEEEDEASEDVKHMKMKDRISKYKSLLQELEEKEKKNEEEYDIEITWEPGLKEKTEEVVKEKIEKSSLTPFEEKLKKMKEERKLKKKTKKTNNTEIKRHNMSSDEKSVDSDTDEMFLNDKSTHKNEDSHIVNKKKIAELSLLAADVTKRETEFDIEKLLTKKKKKWNKKKPKESDDKDDFQIDVNDERFSRIFTDPAFNIDPTDPHYKETKGMQALIHEKSKKRKREVEVDEHNSNERNQMSTEEELRNIKVKLKEKKDIFSNQRRIL